MLLKGYLSQLGALVKIHRLYVCGAQAIPLSTGWGGKRVLEK